ncbi:MAG: Hsp70 family protein [Eubacteriaceae bacterium]|nr:Hsp70 family protein [Eubacteriaceae bacterium]
MPTLNYLFAIDIGDSNAHVSYVDESGRANMVSNYEGFSSTPSVINFEESGRIIVGQIAKEMISIDPSNTAFSMKRDIASGKPIEGTQGKPAEEAYSYIFKKLAGDVEKGLGLGLRGAVLTCPAYFSMIERNALKNAAYIAGITVENIIVDPIAIAFAFAMSVGELPSRVLIVDIGSAKTEASIVAFEGDKARIVASKALQNLAGNEYDLAAASYLAEIFQKQTNRTSDLDEFESIQLALAAEKAKIALSVRTEVPVLINLDGSTTRMELSRRAFEGITSHLTSEIALLAQEACRMDDDGPAITTMLLTGSHARMPAIARSMSSAFPNMAIRIFDPDESAAKGAAFYASTFAKELDGNYAKTEIASPRGSRFTYDIKALKGYCLKVISSSRNNGNQFKYKSLIGMGDPILGSSITVSSRFGTAEQNQSNAEIVVYETDSANDLQTSINTNPLGTATLHLPGNLPYNSPLLVEFTLSRDGILTVGGKDLTSGAKFEGSLDAYNIMSDNDVEALRVSLEDVEVE